MYFQPEDNEAEPPHLLPLQFFRRSTEEICEWGPPRLSTPPN